MLETGFPFGSTGSVPPLEGFYFNYTSWNIIDLYVYHNSSGAWAALGSAKVDTLNLGKLAKGDYKVRVHNHVVRPGVDTDHYYSPHHDSLMLQVSFPLHVTQASTTMQTSVFPNPVGDVLYFDNNKETSNREIILYDGLGNKVLHKMALSKSLAIDVHDLAAGLYFYQIISGNDIEQQGTVLKK